MSLPDGFLLSATNPIANRDQREAEDTALRVMRLPVYRAAREKAGFLWRQGYGEHASDEALETFESAMDEYAFNYLLKAVASDSDYPRLVRDFMPPHAWFRRNVPGARIGGDVIVLGGTYRADDVSPNRNQAAKTMMYAGYQQELRDMMRNPTGVFSPKWTPTYLGTRLLVVLFWFIVSLGLTAAMPGTISRGVARLQTTSLRVAVIGLTGVIVLFAGVLLCLWIMPEPIRVLVGMLALLLWIVAGLFGRVILYAATGRWLQRKYVSLGRNSEAVALLLGTSFWVLLTSLPYVWPFMAAFILIISFGLALTARYRVNWNLTSSN